MMCTTRKSAAKGEEHSDKALIAKREQAADVQAATHHSRPELLHNESMEQMGRVRERKAAKE